MKKENNSKNTGRSSGLVTQESIGAVGAIFTAFAFLILLTGRAIFGDLGYAIKSFLLGVFGYFSYLLFPVLFLASAAAFVGKRFLTKRVVFSLLATVSLGFLIVHTIATYDWALKGYLSRCFREGGNGASAATVAGWCGALPVYLLRKLTGGVGTLIILSLLFLLFFTLTVRFLFGISLWKMLLPRREKTSKESEAQAAQPQPSASQPIAYYPPYSEQPQYQNSYSEKGTNVVYGGYSNGQAPQPPRPEYIPVSSDVRRQPGVRLPDDSTFNVATERPSNAFSPFGYASAPEREQQPTQDYTNDRAFLFGGDPAEHYRKNLIFDSSANVNKKPAADPNQPIFGGNSYTSEYERSVGSGTEFVRPQKVVTDHSPYDGGFAQSGFSTLREQTPSVSLGYEEQKNDYYTPEISAPADSEPYFSEREDDSRWRIGDQSEREIAPTTERRIEPPVEERPTFSQQEEPTRKEPDYRSIFSASNPNIFGGNDDEDDLFSNSSADSRAFDEEEKSGRDSIDFRSSESQFDGVRASERTDEGDVRTERGRSLRIFDDEDDDTRGTESDFRGSRRDEGIAPLERGERAIPPIEGRAIRETGFSERRGIEPVKRETPPPPKPKVIRPYQTAPIHFFDCRDVEPDANMAEVEENKRTILETLSGFKVTDATIASVTYGPTVTRYNVAIPRNISPKKVVSLDQEIAISLYAANGVNIYPNFEEGAVSIEVPNKRRQFVQLGCMLTGDGYVNCKSTSLTFAMGKDVGNRKVYGDIRKMTHLLVAGASGSGKSVFLRCLIISLIVKYSPADLRLILIDPKKTEFVIYDHLPHLVINEIITDTGKVIQSLNWAIGEMNRRYTLFEQKSRSGTYVVNIDEYNANLAEGEEKLPKIVIIVDELADLMLAAQKDIEDRIQNLTQKSRAAGIHMILATQRPSADVITGVIKSNLKTRIAFSVTAEVDSRVILDASGAHKLLGKGDMLYTMEGIATPIRVQSPSIESEDAQKVVNYIKANNDAYFDESATAFINNVKAVGGDASVESSDENVEEVYIEAVRYIILSGSASISMIQRKCSVGYNKAGKIIEWMEEMGYISAFDGAKARKVLITPEEFEEKYGPLT